MQSLETEMEAFLCRLLPGCDQQWQGAAPQEISYIEALAGQSLPPFYQWFLAKMGHNMGAMSIGVHDFSTSTVLSIYQQEEAILEPGKLLIGYEPDDIMPMHIYYDLNTRRRDDAQIFNTPADGGLIYPLFETFREMLAWDALLSYRIRSAPQRCTGCIRSEGSPPNAQLSRILEAQGFTQPIATGDFCGVFERDNAALIWMVPPDDQPKPYLFFDLGGADAGILRQVLDAVATKTDLQVEIER
jgi:hypothetical protein